MSRRSSAAVPGLGFRWVGRLEVDKTRPALERAGYRCECCPRNDGLRVVEGYGQLVVLCPECAMSNGFRLVLSHRNVQMRRRSVA